MGGSALFINGCPNACPRTPHNRSRVTKILRTGIRDKHRDARLNFSLIVPFLEPSLGILFYFGISGRFFQRDRDYRTIREPATYA
jgi:hypothetical protein